MHFTDGEKGTGSFMAPSWSYIPPALLQQDSRISLECIDLVLRRSSRRNLLEFVIITLAILTDAGNASLRPRRSRATQRHQTELFMRPLLTISSCSIIEGERKINWQYDFMIVVRERCHGFSCPRSVILNLSDKSVARPLLQWALSSKLALFSTASNHIVPA